MRQIFWGPGIRIIILLENTGPTAYASKNIFLTNKQSKYIPKSKLEDDNPRQFDQV